MPGVVVKESEVMVLAVGKRSEILCKVMDGVQRTIIDHLSAIEKGGDGQQICCIVVKIATEPVD